VKLYIAEKPSLGRAIAEVLPKPHKKAEGCIWLGNGDCVSWCIGHLLEQAEPDAYDPALKKWSLEQLPIVPKQWQLKVKSKTRKQVSVLRKLVKQADQLVHAGDPDREGQLLVDELIHFLKVKGRKKDSIQRLLVNDLNPQAVKRALSQLRDNREFTALSNSALARSRADWLYGLNLTRANTLQGRKVGYKGVLSVGRVQTPVLGLVARRDREIDDFVSSPFYEVLAWVHPVGEAAQSFKARWQPSEACSAYLDEEGRVLSLALAENVVSRISQKEGEVRSLSCKPKQQAAPLPFSLSALQIEAGKRFGLSAKQVLDGCQTLYERHQLITYPRSDSRHLPKTHFEQGKSVLNALSANLPQLEVGVEGADQALKGRAWNDAKVDAHHAIIPSAKKADVKRLSGAELKIYELIARQYIMQFYPPHRFDETKVEILIAGGLFTAQSKYVKDNGWKEVQLQSKKARYPEGAGADETQVQLLPALSVGQRLFCTKGECLDKQTQPPKAFTDASLLAAMTGIARFVVDKDIRLVLKETDGLGTEATRAGIIELLFKRKFLSRQGKSIRATATGRALVSSLPESTTVPDMTARWESQLNAMLEGQTNYQDFMAELLPNLQRLLDESCANLPHALKGLSA